MPVTTSSMKAAVTNAAVWKRLKDYALTSGRVSFSLIADSNGLHQDFGWLRGLTNGIRQSGVPIFGTGIFGARHNRVKYGVGGGSEIAWPRYTQATAFSGTAATKGLLEISFTTATWDHATLTLTKAGAFTNYSFHAGDRLYVSAVTNGTTGDYTVASRTSNDAIVLTTSIGATASAISATLTGAAGDTARSDIPAAFYRRNNIPAAWGPLGNAMAYHGTSGTFAGSNEIGLPMWGPIPFHGRPCVSSIMVDSAAGKAGKIDFYACNTTYTSAVLVGGTAYSFSGGADGNMNVARTTIGSDTSSVESGTYSGRDWLLAGQGLSTNDSGQGCNWGIHVCNSSMNRGFSMSGLLCRGGMSAYDMAEIARFMDTLTWEAVIYAMADQHDTDCGGNDVVRHCVIINTGFNDAGESATSYDSVNAGSTVAGHTANIQDLMATIRARWNTYRGANADQTELFFMLMPSHCISDAPTTPGTGSFAAQEAATRLYRAAQRSIASGTYNTFFVDLQVLFGSDAYATLNTNRMTFVFDTDVLHLAAPGYDFLAGAAFSALDTAAYGRSFFGLASL